MIDLFEPPSEEELTFRHAIWKNHPDRLENEARTFSIDIEARDFPLNGTYTLAAAVDLERAHGLDLERQLISALAIPINLLTTTSSSSTAAEVKMESYGRSPLFNILPIYLGNVRNGCYLPGQAD